MMAIYLSILKKLVITVAFFPLLVVSCKNFSSEVKTQKAEAELLTGNLKLTSGFKAELLYSPSDDSAGSWVAMAFDNKGRLIASDQYGSLYRLEIPPIGTDSPKVKVERDLFNITNKEGRKILNKVQMGYAQGLVWAFNSLYVVVNHKIDSNFEKTSGLYRLQDTDGDGKFDKITLLKTLEGDEEHGPHSIKLSPDGKSLFITAGNMTKIPENISNYTLPPVWQRDNILPTDNFPLDPRTAPAGGWIAKVDSSGKKWEIVCAGLRNTFDLAFNESGDLFTYDNDMEWDIGMPWYRPTRICFVPSGSEFGWRDGNGKWPPDYLDNIPPILNMGQGAPTNLVSAQDARFPKQYSNTLLAFDWSFGIIYAIHLQPDGASYKAKAEEFVSGAPLPLTDGAIGPDGALYFLTGGRRLESHLYRVYYGKGDEKVLSEIEVANPINEGTKLRRRLEAFQGQPNPAVIALAWPQLKNPDRFVRYAARIAIEHQPVKEWQNLVLMEKEPVVLINGMIALARHGNKNLEGKMFNALETLHYNEIPAPLQIDLLRVFELTLARMGKPDPVQSKNLLAYLSPHYPAATNDLNRGLSKILGFLGDPSLVPKTLALIDDAKDDSTDKAAFANTSDLIMRNPQYGMDLAGLLAKTPPTQQIYYAIVLSDIKVGWTAALREKYFKWFHHAYEFKGGRLYVSYIDKARETALASVPKNQSKYYDKLSTNKASLDEVVDWVKIMSDGGPGRRWKLEDALDRVQNLSNRDFKQAKVMFSAAGCINCHTIGGEGGVIGPDLTQLGTRFSKRDILESIIYPSKTISDQYAATVFTMKDGTSVMGKLIKEDKNKYYISQNPFIPEKIREIEKKNVRSQSIATVSLMPPGLINQLNPERLRDLMAYLESGGNENNPVFSKKNKIKK
jgi:putative heme-binding domain-containing protein